MDGWMVAGCGQIRMDNAGGSTEERIHAGIAKSRKSI